MVRNTFKAPSASSDLAHGARTVISLNDERSALERAVRTRLPRGGPCPKYRPVIPDPAPAGQGAGG